MFSAIEFYGYSQIRQQELNTLDRHFQLTYNNNINDQSLNLDFIMEDMACVIQQGDKYYRVIIK